MSSLFEFILLYRPEPGIRLVVVRRNQPILLAGNSGVSNQQFSWL
jgi:hypothetical protein